MFTVLLISLHDTGTYGHRCISASLQRRGFLVDNLFFQSHSLYQDAVAVTDAELQALGGLVTLLRPDLIGINVHSSFGHPLAARMVDHIKSTLDIPIVLGGIHPTLLPAFCLEHTRTDYVCIGEGEESIVELCQHIRTGSEDPVPGIISRLEPGYQHRRPPANLDLLPFQDVGDERKYTITSRGVVVEGDPLLRGTAYPTKASRGCPFHCGYCSVAQLSALAGSSGFYRLRSVRLVIAEILEFIELNGKCSKVKFWDDTFPFKSTWVEEFSAQYRKTVGLPFSVWLNPDTTKERNIASLRAAGLQDTVMGIESASDATRHEVFLRGESRDEILEADRILSRHAVARTYDFILDHPWESAGELQETFDLVTELKRPFLLNMHSLILLPGTPLAERAIRERLVSADDIIDSIIGDVRAASRRIQWIKGVPAHGTAERSYWLFMILSVAGSLVPIALIKLLAHNSLLQRYPELFCDAEGVIEWRVLDDIPPGLSAVYKRSRTLQTFFNRRPLLKRRTRSCLRTLQRCVETSGWLAYVAFRVATRMPLALWWHSRAVRRRYGST